MKTERTILIPVGQCFRTKEVYDVNTARGDDLRIPSHPQLQADSDQPKLTAKSSFPISFNPNSITPLTDRF